MLGLECWIKRVLGCRGLAVRHWLMTCWLSGRGWVLCRAGS